MFRAPGAKPTIPGRRSSKPKADCWGNYSDGKALTVCVEGGANAGSHGKLHGLTGDFARNIGGRGPQVDYAEVRDKAAKMMENEFGCDKQCIAKQLDDNYKDAYTCGDMEQGKVTRHTGQSHGGYSDD